MFLFNCCLLRSLLTPWASFSFYFLRNSSLSPSISEKLLLSDSTLSMFLYDAYLFKFLLIPWASFSFCFLRKSSLSPSISEKLLLSDSKLSTLLTYSSSELVSSSILPPFLSVFFWFLKGSSSLVSTKLWDLLLSLIFSSVLFFNSPSSLESSKLWDLFFTLMFISVLFFKGSSSLVSTKLGLLALGSRSL